MKEQYFGDVNDFRKYGLLRTLVIPDRLRVGICWMLTEADGRTDGNFLAYLRKPEAHRQSDPELFDWLKQVVEIERDRRTARIEESNLLGFASFQSNLLTDRVSERTKYFADCSSRFSGCDLVFFDPDNGLEVRSKRRGRKDSRKYLYWDETCRVFVSGASVLTYQHFPREEREQYIDRLSEELRERTRAAAVFSFKTPRVLFLLASQERHAAIFRTRLSAIQSNWDSNQIYAEEHRDSVVAKL